MSTPRLVHLDRDLLAAREQVVRRERVAMLELLGVGARHHPHRAVLDRGVGEGDPRGEHVRRTQPQ